MNLIFKYVFSLWGIMLGFLKLRIVFVIKIIFYRRVGVEI